MFIQRLRQGLALSLVALLAACGGSPAAVAPPSDSGYVLTVKLEPTDTQESVAQRYGGKVIAWTDSKAVLEMTPQAVSQMQASGISMQNTTLEANSALNVPMASAQSLSTASGWNAWSGGWNAWSGGWNAWSGGWNAWSGGSTPPQPPAENNAVWSLMQLRQAHALARNFGSGVKVAVIDTGVDTAHPMFAGRLAPSAEWRDFVDNDNNPQEVNANTTPSSFGHGTGVAGLILQVAPRATILPIRVLGPNGQGTLSGVISGINHAVNSGARVINLSLGSTDPSDALLTALSAAKARGVYVVASAGNNGQSEGLTYPARYAWDAEVHPYLLSVGSFNRRSELSLFSAYGNDFMLGGVGEQVVSAYPGSRTAQFTGTSFAAPLVAGTLALAFGETSDSGARANLWNLAAGSALTNDIWARTRSARGLNSDFQIGYGIIDAANLLRSLPGFVEPASTLTNLLPNGGFETTSGWGFDQASRVTSGQRSGTGALSVGVGGAWRGGIAVSPNTSYTLTGWFRMANIADSALLMLDEANAAYTGLTGTMTTVYVTGTAYTSRSLTITTGPNTAFLTVSLWRNSTMNSNFLVDDLRLVRNP